MGFIPDDDQEIPDFQFEDFPDFGSYLGLDQRWYDSLLTAIPLNRSDIIAAEVLVKITDYNLRSAKNSLLPAVDLIGCANFLNTEALKKAREVFDSTKARNPEKDYTVGINFSFPIFNDTARGLVKQQRALRSQAQVNLDLLGSQVVSSFKTAYTFSNALLEEVKKNALAAEEYRKTVEAEKIKLENGLSTYFVVLTLENNWLSALLSFVNSERQFVENLLQLRLLSGTLVRWDPQGEIVTEVEDVFSYPVINDLPSQPVEKFIEELCELSSEEPPNGS
jgi:outer membrane protein